MSRAGAVVVRMAPLSTALYAINYGYQTKSGFKRIASSQLWLPLRHSIYSAYRRMNNLNWMHREIPENRKNSNITMSKAFNIVTIAWEICNPVLVLMIAEFTPTSSIYSLGCKWASGDTKGVFEFCGRVFPDDRACSGQHRPLPHFEGQASNL